MDMIFDLKNRLFGKLQFPVITLMLLLQRTPVVNVLVEKHFNLVPRLAHLVKWVTGSSIVVGGMNTVTGASATVELIEGFNDTTGTVNQFFKISFFSKQHVVGSYRLGTPAPPGLALSPNVNEFGVGSVEGIPTKVGIYNMDLFAYEENNQTGDSTLLALTIYIVDSGPSFTQHPSNLSLSWGGSLFLTAGLANPQGATVQWLKDGVAIEGANGYSFNLQNVTSADEGLYQLRATQDGETADSDASMVTVNASSFETWKETVFADPFSEMTSELQDPDLDGRNNLVEYAIGTDPLYPDKIQVPEVSFEKSLFGDFVVYSIGQNATSEGVTIIPEYSEVIANPNWATIFTGVNGMSLEQIPGKLLVKVPRNYKVFVRFKITDAQFN